VWKNKGCGPPAEKGTEKVFRIEADARIGTNSRSPSFISATAPLAQSAQDDFTARFVRFCFLTEARGDVYRC